MGSSETGRVVVVGNCTLDISFQLPRFPKAGETMLADEPTQDVGGKGANQAVAAARNGAIAELCAAVGMDEEGRRIKAHLCSENIGVEHVREVTAATDKSFIYVTPEGENSIVSTHAAAQSLLQDDVWEALRGVTAADVVLMQGNLSHALTRFSLQEARRRDAITVLNPAPVHYPFDDLWPLVDHAILNEVETELLTGQPDATTGARALMTRGVGHVVITLGSAGALSVSPDEVRELSAEHVEAVDTTGAGDVFCGVFAAGLAHAYPMSMATQVAVHAATLSVTRHGTQSAFPTAAELDRIRTGLEVK